MPLPRYASLYFCCAIEGQDNELITLELIHRYVELLDKYFGSVSFSPSTPLPHPISLPSSYCHPHRSLWRSLWAEVKLVALRTN